MSAEKCLNYQFPKREGGGRLRFLSAADETGCERLRVPQIEPFWPRRRRETHLRDVLKSRLVGLEVRFPIASAKQQILCHVCELSPHERLFQRADGGQFKPKWEVVRSPRWLEDERRPWRQSLGALVGHLLGDLVEVVCAGTVQERNVITYLDIEICPEATDAISKARQSVLDAQVEVVPGGDRYQKIGHWSLGCQSDLDIAGNRSMISSIRK